MYRITYPHRNNSQSRMLECSAHHVARRLYACYLHGADLDFCVRYDRVEGRRERRSFG